ncbi:glycerate kinase [Variovorax guangxiensis]|uniref:Glycerate kinase n=1 Tax=Variovorax guangxiensis TaxID=1775474 RepID=A0A502DGF9_9BURK|nr:glycerate kinase [Variovorax guangxiensis]RZI68838.1 MAG: glycerate kinase [Variovorax sp.]TPG18960.1 glycerate kinase [Variovorax ginsengisoli]TPG23792.1 glycerate kinase [Variovorax guangxiensis]
MRPMNFQKVFVPLTGLLLLGLSYRSFGWSGVAVACTGIVMFLLLHFTRTMQVLKRAADRPIGYVASAVMLNAKLKPGVTLLHVVAMTRSLGLLKTPKEQQPETYRWTDGGLSYVEGIFLNGKLQSWTLTRPPVEDDAAPVALQDGNPPPAV